MLRYSSIYWAVQDPWKQEKEPMVDEMREKKWMLLFLFLFQIQKKKGFGVPYSIVPLELFHSDANAYCFPFNIELYFLKTVTIIKDVPSFCFPVAFCWSFLIFAFSTFSLISYFTFPFFLSCFRFFPYRSTEPLHFVGTKKTNQHSSLERSPHFSAHIWFTTANWLLLEHLFPISIYLLALVSVFFHCHFQ